MGAAGEGEPVNAVAKGGWYALALVALTNAMSLLDRQILAILAPAIKKDLAIGDAEMGLLYGTVFALFYALFSLPVGRLADGWVRTRLLGISIAFWSAATALGGLAGSFATLALSRLGVGIGEAATQPAGTSLIYDYWPKPRRGFVMAVLASAIALGLGGSLVLGGVAAQAWTERYAGTVAPFGLKGWQFAFLVASAPGFVLALFLLRLREPERGVMDGLPSAPDPRPFAASLELLGSVLPGLHWIGMIRRGGDRGTVLRNLAGLAAIVALMVVLTRVSMAVSPRPPFVIAGLAINPHAAMDRDRLRRVRDRQSGAGDAAVRSAGAPRHHAIAHADHGDRGRHAAVGDQLWHDGVQPHVPDPELCLSMRETALQFGMVSAGMGIVGPMLWGPLSDRLHRRYPGGGRAGVALFAMAVSPLLSFWVYTAGGGTFYGRFVLYSLVLTGWMPPLYAILYDQVLPRMRGLTASLYLLAMTILGMGIGPIWSGCCPTRPATCAPRCSASTRWPCRSWC
jgi:MFS family permease